MGFIDHTNEHLIGTNLGVLECRAIRRHDQTEQFDASKIEELKGAPWKPVPNKDGLKIPTNILPDGKILDENGDEDGYAEEETVEEEFNTGVDTSQDEGIESESKKEDE